MRAIVRHKHETQMVKAFNPMGPGGHNRFVAADLALPAGSWVIFAKADVQNISGFPQPFVIRCFLDIVGADTVQDRSDAEVPGQSIRQTVSLIVGANVPGSATAELSCSVDADNKFEISNIALAAMQVESVDELVPVLPGVISVLLPQPS